MGTVVIADRIYLDAAGRVTTDPGQADRLWATPGMEVSESEAAAVGWPLGKAPKAVRAPKGTKMVGAPEGDK